MKLLFGSDIDFPLVECGRYIVIKDNGGTLVLADEDERRGTKAVPVSTSFGPRYRQLVSRGGVQIDLSIFVFQLDAIVRAVEKLKIKDAHGAKDKLEMLLWRNASELLKVDI